MYKCTDRALDRQALGAFDALLALHGVVPELLLALLLRGRAQAGRGRRDRWWSRATTTPVRRRRGVELEGADVAAAGDAAAEEAALVGGRTGGEWVSDRQD